MKRFILLPLILTACGLGKKISGTCDESSSLRFQLQSVKEGLPLDSLQASIKLGDKQTYPFSINLKTGVSTADFSAKQGDSYQIHYELFSAGRPIGFGDGEGVLACDLNVSLNPVWDSSEIAGVKISLSQGQILSNILSSQYSQANERQELHLDLPPSEYYRFWLKYGDSVLVSGEGSTVTLVIPENTAGKTLVVKLHAIEGNKIIEEKIWSIRIVQTTLPSQLISQISLPDSGSVKGNRIQYEYSGQKIKRMLYYDEIALSSNSKPTRIDSLFYDADDDMVEKKSEITAFDPIDSLFRYELIKGNKCLKAIEVHRGDDRILDSLLYEGDRLTGTLHFVNQGLAESSVLHWVDDDKRVDSVFSHSQNPKLLKRIVNQTFAYGKRIESQILAGEGVLEPISLERIRYHALGEVLLRQSFSEGEKLQLETSESSSFDSLGRKISLRVRDEISGETLQWVAFEYGEGLKKKAQNQGDLFHSLANTANPSSTQILNQTVIQSEHQEIVAILGTLHGKESPLFNRVRSTLSINPWY